MPIDDQPQSTPNVSRHDALRIASNAVGGNVAESDLTCHDERPRCSAYFIANEPCWYIHAPWDDGLLAIRSSRLIVVGKFTGLIHFDGSAGDEG